MKRITNDYIHPSKFALFIKDLEESYTKLKIIFHEEDDSEEVVKFINSLKKDPKVRTSNFELRKAVSWLLLTVQQVSKRYYGVLLYMFTIGTFIRINSAELMLICNNKAYSHMTFNSIVLLCQVWINNCILIFLFTLRYRLNVKILQN